MTLENAISELLQIKDCVIVGSLGNISKELERLDNGQNKLILVKGAMGCAMGVGLGYALNTKKEVYVVIGDGAFLMKAGSLATIERYKPKNLHIIILNNNCHDSCGGQPTNFKYFKFNEEVYPRWNIQKIAPKSHD